MKNVRIVILQALLLVPAVLTAQTLIDRTAAIVDKEVITESELNERVTFMAMQNRIDPNQPGLRAQVLDGMISEKLILAQARIDSIEVSDEEVANALEQRIADFIRQVGSEKRVEEIYGKPIGRIKREYRDEIRNQLLVQRERQQRESSITVSRREVEEFFTAYKDSLPQVPEEYELSHIYMVPKPDTSMETKTRKFMQAILDSIRAGGDFADFARRYSTDPGSAAGGGDLGWEKRGVFVREFEETAFALKEGDISGIIKTQFGFHIIQLMGRRGESVRTRHILMKIDKGPASDSAVIETLKALKDRILKGESFSELAKQFSEDEDTKSTGGDLGTLTIDQLQPDFAQQVKDMKEGEISDPHRTVVGSSYGFHIVWMRKKTPAHIINIQNDFRRIEQLALYIKRNRLHAEWLDQLRKNIYVDIRI
ncbi:MAG: peptidylprolyl isomerase [Bacteroidetes bacterium]|nr:peptidylprolyl isomerase [Bacteroidota bacterium]